MACIIITESKPPVGELENGWSPYKERPKKRTLIQTQSAILETRGALYAKHQLLSCIINEFAFAQVVLEPLSAPLPSKSTT